MDTPLGLTYKPIFPALLSIYKQVEQSQLQREKAAEEQRKNALTRVNDAMDSFYKYNPPDYPYTTAVEPYMQAQTNDIIATAGRVKRGEVNPEVLSEKMARFNQEAAQLKRKDAFLAPHYKAWEDSKVMNMGIIKQKIGSGIYDLRSTSETGVPVPNTPSNYFPEQTVQGVNTDLAVYNPYALSEILIKDLERTEADTQAALIPGGTAKTTGIPTFLMKSAGSSGQSVVDIGAFNEDKANILLRRYRALSPYHDNYIKLRAAAEVPGFSEMKVNSEEWGNALKTALQNTLDETGFVGRKTAETVKPTPTEADKLGTAFDPTKIGLSAKNEFLAKQQAKFVNRVISQDPRALSFFSGPGVKSVEYWTDGTLRIMPTAGKVDKLAEIVGSIKGARVDADGAAIIPNSRNGVGGIIHFKNSVSGGPSGDWNDLWTEEAYNQLYPESNKSAPAKAAPAKAAPETKEEKAKDLKSILTPVATVVDLSDAPSQADIDEFLKKAPAGTRYKTKDGKIKTKK